MNTTMCGLMRRAMKDPYRSTFHRDGSVTLWNVFTQTWQRFVNMPADSILATLTAKERARIARHMGRTS